METTDELITRGDVQRHRDINNGLASRRAYSEYSYNEGDSAVTTSSCVSFEKSKDSTKVSDVRTTICTDMAVVNGTCATPSTSHTRNRLGDDAHLGDDCKKNVSDGDLERVMDMKCFQNNRLGDEPPLKLAVDYSFDDKRFKNVKQKNHHSAQYKPLKDLEYGHCVSTFYTVITMSLMLIALLIPAVFHICCQFRLYGSVVLIAESLSDIYEAKKEPWTIMDRLGEFESFFVLGVFLYISIQAAGFYATRARIHRYLKRLCVLSVESSKHEFLYNSKHRAMEYFSDYTNRLYRDQTNAYARAEENLMKAFDDASLKFDNHHVENVWYQTTFVRYRMSFLRIYLPMLIYMVASIGLSAFVYDRRFRMHHRVPLAHPELLSNLYWYAAIQYEGVWCIFSMFVLNFMTWLYLCHTNRHKTLFGLLEEAHDQIQTIASNYGTKLAKDIWENQMLLFSSTIYAIDSNKGSRNSVYAPGRLETFNSQINFSSTETHRSKRPCLCHCLCLPTIEEGTSAPISFMAASPLEELHAPLLDSALHDVFKQQSMTIVQH